jgi:DNA-directed RNA polymerase subunit RPC12/RpoP
MPFIIKCANCGYLFYYGLSIESLETILKPLNKCPQCGKKIEKDPSKIKTIIEAYREG